MNNCKTIIFGTAFGTHLLKRRIARANRVRATRSMPPTATIFLGFGTEYKEKGQNGSTI